MRVVRRTPNWLFPMQLAREDRQTRAGFLSSYFGGRVSNNFKMTICKNLKLRDRGKKKLGKKGKDEPGALQGQN